MLAVIPQGPTFKVCFVEYIKGKAPKASTQ